MRFHLISTLPNLFLSLVNMYPLRNKSPSVKSVPGSCCTLPWPCNSSAYDTPPGPPPASCHPGQCSLDTRDRDPGALSPELPEWTPPKAPRLAQRAEGSSDRTRGLTLAHMCLSSDTAAGAGSMGKGQRGWAEGLQTAHDPSESRVFPSVKW